MRPHKLIEALKRSDHVELQDVCDAFHYLDEYEKRDIIIKDSKFPISAIDTNMIASCELNFWHKIENLLAIDVFKKEKAKKNIKIDKATFPIDHISTSYFISCFSLN